MTDHIISEDQLSSLKIGAQKQFAPSLTDPLTDLEIETLRVMIKRHRQKMRILAHIEQFEKEVMPDD